MKTFAKVFNIVMLALILVGDVLYINAHTWFPNIDTLIIKSITSALFVIVGAVNLFLAVKFKTNHLKFSIIIFVGLVFGMLGDILLEINSMFIMGAGLFAVGHVFYFIAYCFIEKFNWKDLIYGLSIFVAALLFILLAPIFDFGGNLMKIVCIIYALIISLMVGKALANCIKLRNAISVLILVGSVLFFFSDLMLLIRLFALPGNYLLKVLCLGSYYPAQFLLGFTILFACKKKK